jgi:hypothetical protein
MTERKKTKRKKTKRKKTKRKKKFAPPTLTITVTVTQGEAVWELNDRTNDWLASDQAEAIVSINEWLSEQGAKGLSDE